MECLSRAPCRVSSQECPRRVGKKILFQERLPQVINKESMRKLCLTVTSVGLCRYSGSWASRCFFIYIVNCFMGLVFQKLFKEIFLFSGMD